MNKKTQKPKSKKASKAIPPRTNQSISMLRLHYKFWILFGVIILAGICIVLRVETPTTWTFLYALASWAALTTNPGSSPR